MKARLISTPCLSVQERGLVLTMALLSGDKAYHCLRFVASETRERLEEALPNVLLVGPRAIAIEFRRMLSLHVEGVTYIHPSWLSALYEGESLSTQAIIKRELQGVSTHRQLVSSWFRAEISKKLVGMYREPSPHWMHRLAEWAEPELAVIVRELGPEMMGRALGELGSELLQRLAQRFPIEKGQQFLEAAGQGFSADAFSRLQSIVTQQGVPIR